MYIIIVRERKYIKYVSFLVVPRKVFRSLHAGVISYMDLYICCTFTSTCTAADDLSLDELLTRVGEK